MIDFNDSDFFFVPRKVNYYKKKVGADNKKTTVNKEQVNYIRSMKGQIRQVDLASEFGITQGMISQIQNNKYWKL